MAEDAPEDASLGREICAIVEDFKLTLDRTKQIIEEVRQLRKENTLMKKDLADMSELCRKLKKNCEK